MIYTDPITLKLVVKSCDLTPSMIDQFVDTHMSKPISALSKVKTKRRKEIGVVPPKYIMKLISPRSTMAIEHIFYCKNHLLSELTRNWGSNDKWDIIV